MSADLASVLTELHSIKEILLKILDKNSITLNAQIQENPTKETSPATPDGHTNGEWRLVDEWEQVTSRKNRTARKTPTRPVYNPARNTSPRPAQNTWVTENPFQALQFVTNQHCAINSPNFKGFEDDYIPEDSSPNDFDSSYPVLSNFNPANSSSSPYQPKQSRRPNIVTSQCPENDDPLNYRKTKTVPGDKLYSKAHRKNITIVADSLCRSIRREEINNDARNFGLENVDVDIHKFPAATTRQIHHYSKINILDNDTDGLIIHSGTNSLRIDSLSDEELAQEIIDIGSLYIGSSTYKV